MTTHWAPRLVEELRQIDRAEAPHGLYGLRHARQTGARPPKLIAVLRGPSVRLVQRLGGTPYQGWPSPDDLVFKLDGARTVMIRVRTYADTKVRRFGSTYRLDTKTAVTHEPVPDLVSEVPKLAQQAARMHPRDGYSHGLLFIGHFGAEKDGVALLGRAISPDFVARYGLTHIGATWQDVHGRDFWSMIQLWYAEQAPGA